MINPVYSASPERYTNGMKYRRCGRSGIMLPEISLGLWQNFGDKAPLERSRDILLHAFDNGICHFDLANNYGPAAGSAEMNFGKILNKDLKNYRDEMIISTKAGYYMWAGPYGEWGSKKHLIASLDQSLKRMNVDYVDIFYHHRMDPDTPLYETMWALDSIVKSGKALYIGLSNYDGETMEKAASILEQLHCPFVINQNKYSILDRTVEENRLIKCSIAKKKGLIAFSPLAQGLLTDRYLDGIPEDSRVRTDGRFLNENSLSAEVIRKVESLNEIAKNRGQTLAQMALSWVYSREGVTSVLIGASKPEQILQNLKMLDNLNFTEEECRQVNSIVSCE